MPAEFTVRRAAEILALGAFPVIPRAALENQQSDQAGLLRLLEPVRRFRALYAYRKTYHNVGVVYSVPSLMWPPAFGDENARFEAFERACDMLRGNNIPFDVVILNHPLMENETERLRLLGKYDALILPRVECASDSQIEALQRFAQKGGRIYTDGPVATFDENSTPRGRTGIPDAEIHDLNGPGGVLDDIRGVSWVRLPHAGTGLTASAWRSNGGRMYAVHLARAEPTGTDGSGTGSPLPDSLSVSLTAPKSFEPDTALFITPEKPDGVPIPIERDAEGALTASVPLPESYGVLAYSSGGFLEKVSAHLAERIVQTRITTRREVAEREERRALVKRAEMSLERIGDATAEEPGSEEPPLPLRR